MAKDQQGVLLLPLSEVYVSSFLYLFYTLIKRYDTKALSDQVILDLHFRLKMKYHGIAVLSLSITMGYLYMYSEYFFSNCV